MLCMERDVLSALHFDLAAPTARSFLPRFLRAADADAVGGERDKVCARGEAGLAALFGKLPSKPTPIMFVHIYML